MDCLEKFGIQMKRYTAHSFQKYSSLLVEIILYHQLFIPRGLSFEILLLSFVSCTSEISRMLSIFRHALSTNALGNNPVSGMLIILCLQFT